MNRPRLLVVSHVLPFPETAGQQLRVFYTLKAVAEAFHVTFATIARADAAGSIRAGLSALCDDVLLLEPADGGRGARRIRHRAAGAVYAARTGLKRSNYTIGRLQFSPKRVAALLDGRRFDCALFEYWHAADSVPVLRDRSIPCVLDMHDVLWQAYRRQLALQRGVPAVWKQWAVRRYRRAEELAWGRFDALVAINRDEAKYVATVLNPRQRVFHAPMGIDLSRWPFGWMPSDPPRIVYYGGLATRHNQEDALFCARRVMPLVWRRRPAAELSIVGSNPPDHLRRLGADRRIHVTGFVRDVQSLLRTMNVVVCPWSGTYGFRSRLIEVMALGVPTVASPDAVYGMELGRDRGVLLGADDQTMAGHVLRLLEDASLAERHSRMAREQVERTFSFDQTYGRFVTELDDWLRRERAAHA